MGRACAAWSALRHRGVAGSCVRGFPQADARKPHRIAAVVSASVDCCRTRKVEAGSGEEDEAICATVARRSSVGMGGFEKNGQVG